MAVQVLSSTLRAIISELWALESFDKAKIAKYMRCLLQLTLAGPLEQSIAVMEEICDTVKKEIEVRRALIGPLYRPHSPDVHSPREFGTNSKLRLKGPFHPSSWSGSSPQRSTTASTSMPETTRRCPRNGSGSRSPWPTTFGTAGRWRRSCRSAVRRSNGTNSRTTRALARVPRLRATHCLAA